MKSDPAPPRFVPTVTAMAGIRVLQAGDRFLAESNAPCFYVAGGSRLIPADRFERADMLRWMFFEQYNHEPNIATLRFWLAYVGEDQLSEAQKGQLGAKRAAGDAALKLMDEHLENRAFFVGDRLSLADIALYAYTHVAEEGRFDLSAYPALSRWIDRVAAEPGYLAIG